MPAMNGEKRAYRWAIGMLVGVLIFVSGFFMRDVTLGADVNANVLGINQNTQEIVHVKESVSTMQASVDKALDDLKMEVRDLKQWLIANR